MADLIIATEALSAGLVTRRQLSRRYAMVYRNVYRPRGVDLDACDRAVAARNAGARHIRRLRRVLALADGGAESPRWPQWKVGVEYDGAQHWTDSVNYADDIDRLEFLAGLGWQIVRVSGRHLRFDSAGVVARTAAALPAGGWDPRHCR